MLGLRQRPRRGRARHEGFGPDLIQGWLVATKDSAGPIFGDTLLDRELSEQHSAEPACHPPPDKQRA